MSCKISRETPLISPLFFALAMNMPCIRRFVDSENNTWLYPDTGPPTTTGRVLFKAQENVPTFQLTNQAHRQ